MRRGFFIDGERALKQTLRERETQLAALVDKLSGYENEVEKSLSNYEQLVRISTKLEAMEGKKRENSVLGGSNDNVTLRSRTKASAVKENVLATDTLQDVGTSEPSRDRFTGISYSRDGHTPGMFPDDANRLVVASNVDQLTVSIMSWAALLATYMLS